MKVTNKKSDITRARNLVRGALSRLRTLSTPDDERDPWQQEQLAQQQINRAVAIARQSLGRTQLADFERWVTDSVSEQHRSASRLGAPLTSLGLLPPELASRDLATELRLTLDQLDRRFAQLIAFANDARLIAQAIGDRDWSGAASVLKSAVKRDGYSYWAVETDIHLKQMSQGVEALKAHIGSLSICVLGLNRFFLYYFGVRNEPAQTTPRFKANLRKRIEEADLSLPLQTYSKYRLYGWLEADTAALSRVLAYEQLTTPIDLMFTALKVCRLIVNRPAAFSLEVIAVANNLREKLQLVEAALGLSRNESERINLCPVRMAAYAVRETFSPGRFDGKFSVHDDAIVRGLASQLGARDEGIAAEELLKQMLNVSWIPIAVELVDVSLVPPLPRFLVNAGVEESLLDEPIASLRSIFRLERPDLLPTETVKLLRVFADVRKDGLAPFEVADCLRKAIDASENPVERDALQIVLATSLQKEGELQECLSICAEAGMGNDKLIPLLPLLEIFQGSKWPALRRFGPSVDLSIALDHFLRVVEDRKIRTYKRYSVEELMKHYACSSVVDLAEALFAAKVPVSKIEYFFSQVCDIFTLELLPGMGESRKVRLLRTQLLRTLAGMHTRLEGSYLQEAQAIEDGLQVDDGLSVLDDSKVHVDEQAVLNFANQELAADFQRYLSLVRSGVGVSESINDVVKSFKNPSAKLFQIPKNDADDLLAELLGAVLNRFLFDPASGLDIIVGRRIRHGTIAGEIRGVLEKSELIGHKPRTGASYDPPPKVSRLCTKIDAKRSRIVFAAFGRFSDSIDQLVALLRDEYFHVRSKSKPRGVFDLQMSSVVLALARSVAQTCETIEQFSKECVDLFWFFLSFRVEVARPAVEAEIRKTLQTIFFKITNELRALNINDPSFFAELQGAADELQRRAATLASWIRVPKVSLEGKTYSMQRIVDVAVAVVTGQRPGFSPLVSSTLPINLELDGHGFSIVSDVLYIALDNVGQHSGKKVGNRVLIHIIYDKIASLISFEIISDVAPGSRSTEKESRLSSIRSDIQKRAYGERVRLDRHSGLFKLAALVGQSDKTAISFGYADGDRFVLKFDLVYVGLSPATASPALLDKSDDLLTTIGASPIHQHLE